MSICLFLTHDLFSFQGTIVARQGSLVKGRKRLWAVLVLVCAIDWETRMIYLRLGRRPGPDAVSQRGR